jgi:hypothetical protein
MLVKTLCTCSCGMVLMMHVRKTRLPIWWVSDCEGNHRQIPSALLVAVTWLQHTWRPRFRRGTFGYRRTTSPTREVEYEYRVFMRMHVSMPKVPKCMCYAIHAKKWQKLVIHRVVSKTKRIRSGLRIRLNLWLARNFWTTELWLITTGTNNTLQRSLRKEMFKPGITSMTVFRITKQHLELQCRLDAQQVPSSTNHNS